MYNLGAGLLLQLGRFGVIDAAVTGSRGDQQGTQTSLGYQYQSPRFNVDVHGIQTDGEYRDLGSALGIPVPRRQLYASLSVPFDRQSLALTYVRQDASRWGGSRIFSLGYSGAFGNHVNVFANVFRDLDLQDSTGAFVGVSVAWNDRLSASANMSRHDGRNTVSVGAARSVDYDAGGLGWNVALDTGDDAYRHGLARVNYRGRAGDVALQVERSSQPRVDYNNATLSAAGSLVLMDGQWLLSRSVYNAFALVSTQGEGAVPVRRENRLIGQTNRRGYLLVPDLLPWQVNRLSIDTVDLPAQVSVASDRIEVVPRQDGGVLASFPIGRYQGAVVILHDAQGQPLPSGTVVTLLATGATALVGMGGEVFLPDLQAANRLSADVEGQECRAYFVFEEKDAMKTLGPFVCAGAPSP